MSPSGSREWIEDARRTLVELGQATKEFPAFFPHGITKLELEFAFTERSSIKILVEGPEKSNDAAGG